MSYIKAGINSKSEGDLPHLAKVYYTRDYIVSLNIRLGAAAKLY